MSSGLRNRGVRAALASAVLFGASTPVAKLVLGQGVSPWVLAGLLYLGSGAGLLVYRRLRRLPPARLPHEHRAALVGAVALGGILGPSLLMAGLSAMPASGASLLLNLESVFTAALAWVVFRENVDRRVALGMLSIVAGAAVVGASTRVELGTAWPAIAIAVACLAWALDNNLTRVVSVADATWLAAVKGAVAGPVNIVLALVVGARLPPADAAATALIVGFLGYGLSLTLFIVALRELGAARSGAYFAAAPFAGATLALLLGEPPTLSLAVAGALMGAGVWLHLTERHEHAHTHRAQSHEHWHAHDAHHTHEHDPSAPPLRLGGHRHAHTHDEITHTHPHYPDIHHRHAHPK